MKCLIEPAFDTPIVSFHIANRRGTACEPFGLEGLVCHTAEMGFRGAGYLTREAFDEEVDRLGAGLGIGTRRDYLTLRGTCLTRHLDALFDLAVSTIHVPRFEQSEHEQLLRETRYELDDLRDDDASLAHRYLAKHLHPGYVYSRTALGTCESLSRIDLETSRALHPRLFRPSDLVLGVAGPITEEQAHALAARLPQDREAEAIPAPDLSPPPLEAKRRLVVVDKPGREQCQVAMGHLAPRYGTTGHDRLQVAEAAFGGMFTSRLMQEIRVKEGWSYGTSCSLNRALGPHSLQMTMAPAEDVCAKAIARMLELYTELHTDGLRDEEFDFTRAYLLGSAAFERATANQRLFRAMQEELFGLPKGYADGFSERLADMSASDISEAIREHTKPDALCVVVVATASKTLAALEALGWDEVLVESHDSY